MPVENSASKFPLTYKFWEAVGETEVLTKASKKETKEIFQHFIGFLIAAPQNKINGHKVS